MTKEEKEKLKEEGEERTEIENAPLGVTTITELDLRIETLACRISQEAVTHTVW